MSLYDAVKLALAAAAVILGAAMMIKPERCVKKGNEGNAAEVEKMRRGGKIIVAVGIIAFILNVVLIVKY